MVTIIRTWGGLKLVSNMSDPRWTWNSSSGHPGLYGPPLATLGHLGHLGHGELYITVIVDANVVQHGGTWNTMGVGPIEFEWKAARPSRFLLIENSQALPHHPVQCCITHTHSKYDIAVSDWLYQIQISLILERIQPKSRALFLLTSNMSVWCVPFDIEVQGCAKC